MKQPLSGLQFKGLENLIDSAEIDNCKSGTPS